MSNIAVGQLAPDFNVTDEAGNQIQLQDFKGKKLILFFYPKASTPGCTAEACNLNDHYADLKSKGFEIIGVSADETKRQVNFKNKYDFGFPLIPDTEKEIIKAYGVWGLKKMYGREYEGIFRKTFVIDEEGKIEKIFEKVKTKDHAAQILNEYEF
jgi:peroxiredoxin Q/BCP